MFQQTCMLCNVPNVPTGDYRPRYLHNKNLIDLYFLAIHKITISQILDQRKK